MQDEASEITRGIRIAYKGIDLIDGAKANPLDFAEDQTALSPCTTMGLGMTQGDHPVLGKNAVYVTFNRRDSPHTVRGKADGHAEAAPQKKTK
ncbi:MAG TPA: hypothetical protein VFG53_03005 [Anaeromyxobacter sp.]|nr:hypothetical protein [Anaeromyxobacter sp.]